MILLLTFLGIIYYFVFRKLGQIAAKRHNFGLLSRLLKFFLVYFVVFLITFINIELLTGEFLIKSNMHTAVGLPAVMAAFGYFFGSKGEGVDLEEEHQQQLNEKDEELVQVKKKITAYKGMLMRYRYNANRLGIDPASLETPIPPRNADEGSCG